MKEESVHSLTTMSDSLSFLATYYGIKGVTGVVNGDLPGWSDVNRAALYRLWSLKLRFQLFHKVGAAPKLTNDVHKAACCLCYALANTLDTWIQLPAETLSLCSTDCGAINEGYWQERVFEAFVLRLYHLWEGTEPAQEIKNHDLGPYSGILA